MQITKVIKRLPQSVNIHFKSVKFLLITFVELSIFWRVLVALTVKTDTKYGEWFYLFICFFLPCCFQSMWKRLCNVPDGCKTSCPCFSSAVKGGMMGFLESGLFQDLGLMLSVGFYPLQLLLVVLWQALRAPRAPSQELLMDVACVTVTEDIYMTKLL